MLFLLLLVVVIIVVIIVVIVVIIVVIVVIIVFIVVSVVIIVCYCCLGPGQAPPTVHPQPRATDVFQEGDDAREFLVDVNYCSFLF